MTADNRRLDHIAAADHACDIYMKRAPGRESSINSSISVPIKRHNQRVPRDIQEVLSRARQTIEFARMSQRDFAEGGERRLVGLQSAITYGRSVTLAVQTLKNSVVGFDAWYEPIRQRLASDPAARWFLERLSTVM